MKKLIIAIIIVIVLGGGYFWKFRRKPPAKVMVEPVKRGVLELTAPSSTAAQVRAHQEVMIIPQIGGKLVELKVDQGDYVKKGQLLAVLDPTEYEIALQDALANLKQAQERLQQAQLRYQRQPELTQSDVAQAEANLESALRRQQQDKINLETQPPRDQKAIEEAKQSLERARAYLEDLKRGARQQEIAQAEAEVRRSEANLQSAQADYDRYKALYDKGYIARMELDHARTQVQVAQAQLDSARERLDLVRHQTREMQLRMAEADLQRAEQAYEDAKLAAAQNLKRLKEALALSTAEVSRAQAALEAAKARANEPAISARDVALAKAAVASAQTRVDTARTRLGYMYIKAPIAGYVARLLVKAGEYVTGGAVGLAAQQMQLMTIIDTSGLYVEPQIDEVDIAKVKLGQPVRVKSDAFPNDTFKGTVVEIAPAASVGQGQGVQTFQVKVALETGKDKLRPGMSANVEIITKRLENVLLCPTVAIQHSGEEATVFVVSGSRAQKRKVVLGESNWRVTEIKSGLKEGEKVVTNPDAKFLVDGGVAQVVTPEQLKRMAAGRKAL